MIKFPFALQMSAISVSPKFRPVLDPEFLPASLWNGAYRALTHTSGADPLALALETVGSPFSAPPFCRPKASTSPSTIATPSAC